MSTAESRTNAAGITRIDGGAPDYAWGGPSAVRAGDLLFTSGLLASDGVSGLAPAARPAPGRPFEDLDVKLQTRQIFGHLIATLGKAGAGLENILRMDQFCIERKRAFGYIETRNEFILDKRPPSVLVAAEQHVVPGAVIQLDAIAAVPPDEQAPTISNSDALPFNEGGGYSQAATTGDWVFIAGSVASDLIGGGPYKGGYGTGIAPQARIDENYWYGSEIKNQTHYVMDAKLKPMLEAGGSSLNDVAHAQIYLTDVEADWPGFLEAWREIYPDGGPPISLYPVSTFGTTGARIEICLIGVRSGGSLTREPLTFDDAPPALGHGPQAMRVGPFVFFSTQLAADAAGLAGDAGINDGMPHHHHPTKKEVAFILRGIERQCQQLGGGLHSLVRSRMLLTGIDGLAPALDVWDELLGEEKPATAPMVVRGPFPVPACSVALDVIAYIPNQAPSV